MLPPNSAASLGRFQTSAATVDAIERARDHLDDHVIRRADRRFTRRRAVSVNVTTGLRATEDRAIEPGMLWVFVLDGTELEPTAFVELLEVFDGHPDLDMAYGDAAGGPTGDAGGRLPWLLPGFSPDRLADQFYLGHVVAVRPHRLVGTGEGPEPAVVDTMSLSGPWSLAAVARTVAHLPVPLYTAAARIDAWGPERLPGISRPAQHGRRWPLASIVIPTNGSTRDVDGRPTRLVDQAVRSVLASEYPRLEIVVVETPGAPPDLASRLNDLVGRAAESGDKSITMVRDDRPFNFSNACNRGAIRSSGDVLVFLNDDTRVVNPDWLLFLVDHALEPDIGAVGARLLYEDGRVQHSGIWSRGGHPTHRYEGTPGDADGYLGALEVAQNCLAVTGACLAVERSKFESVGGFSPVFPNSYNDVDLCLKLLDRGHRTVVEPRAELFHYEASTRDPSITDDDLVALHDRWRWRLNHDPFDNPNHTAERSEEWPVPETVDNAGSRHEPRFWPPAPVGVVSPY